VTSIVKLTRVRRPIAILIARRVLGGILVRNNNQGESQQDKTAQHSGGPTPDYGWPSAFFDETLDFSTEIITRFADLLVRELYLYGIRPKKSDSPGRDKLKEKDTERCGGSDKGDDKCVR
jgi:hypothetical protein